MGIRAKALLVAVWASIGIAGSSSRADFQFVNATTNNGSFETGVIAPWAPFSNPNPAPAIITSAALASDGQNFAQIQATTSTFTANFLVAASPALDPQQGRVVRLAWDARLPAAGDVFSAISTSAWGNDPTDSIVATISVLQGGVVNSSGWTHNVQDLTLDPARMAAVPSLHFALGFTRFSPVAGHTYTGWIDNATMTQIPEPASLGAIALFVGCASSSRRRPRR